MPRNGTDRPSASLPATRRPVTAALLLLASLAGGTPAANLPAGATATGQAVYDFYCYQCHGYAGDARTLASSMLDPQPRNFTAADPAVLTRERMIGSVSNGRPGTAMTTFASVLDATQIAAVVDYIRTRFMSGEQPALRYHTPANGWEDHERYRDAFPFASGELPLDTSWEALTPAQQRGRQLYMQACITCHDRATVTDAGAVWELRALSYPRRHYSHTVPVDATSGASPYALHDRPPEAAELTAQERRGESLYQDNCAFCHAADGTARNWIGSFLEPRPRNLTGAQVAAMERDRLRAVIRDGLPGTSMPAWRHVLADAQIEDIISYIRRVFRENS